MADLNDPSRRAHVVAARGHLPGLRPQLRRQRRRRDRRPARHHLAAALPARPRRRRALAHAVLHLAAARPRVRRRRLLRRRPAVRHPRRRRRADRAGARAGPAGDRRPGAQPHLRRARLVPGGAGRRPGQPGAGALPVPRRPRRAGGHAAQQLAVGLRRPGVDPGRRTASGTSTSSTPPSPTSTGATPRSATCSTTCCASGSTAASTASGSTSPTACSRRRACATRSSRRASARQRRGQREHSMVERDAARRADVGPARGARRLPPLARRARRSTTATGWPSPRRGPRPRSRWPRYVRPDELQPGVQLRLAARAVVGRRRSARSSPTPSRPSARSARSPTWVLSNHDVVRHVTRYGGGDGRPGPRPGRDADDARAARLGVPLPGRGARPRAGRRRARRTGRTRRGSAPARSAATAAGCRSRGAATRRRTASARGRGQPWIPQPDDWASRSRRRGADADSTLAFYRAALAARRTLRDDGGRRRRAARRRDRRRAGAPPRRPARCCSTAAPPPVAAARGPRCSRAAAPVDRRAAARHRVWLG